MYVNTIPTIAIVLVLRQNSTIVANSKHFAGCVTHGFPLLWVNLNSVALTGYVSR